MHPRKRKIAIVLLSIGTIVGFGSGFASMRHRACARRDAFEQRVASVCVDAARRSDAEMARAVGEPDTVAERDDDAQDEKGDHHRGRGHGRRHGSDNLR